MRRYGICGIIVLVTAVVCFSAGFFINRSGERQESASSDTARETKIEIETETAPEPRAVVNQREVEPAAANAKEEFYLVSETGYLLVFAQDQSTICLHTHIPITEFPEREQEKLRAGIWFSSMMEIFHYLESYTS